MSIRGVLERAAAVHRPLLLRRKILRVWPFTDLFICRKHREPQAHPDPFRLLQGGPEGRRRTQVHSFCLPEAPRAAGAPRSVSSPTGRSGEPQAHSDPLLLPTGRLSGPQLLSALAKLGGPEGRRPSEFLFPAALRRRSRRRAAERGSAFRATMGQLQQSVRRGEQP